MAYNFAPTSLQPTTRNPQSETRKHRPATRSQPVTRNPQPVMRSPQLATQCPIPQGTTRHPHPATRVASNSQLAMRNPTPLRLPPAMRNLPATSNLQHETSNPQPAIRQRHPANHTNCLWSELLHKEWHAESICNLLSNVIWSSLYRSYIEDEPEPWTYLACAMVPQ